MRILIPFLILCTPAWATCPAAPDHRENLDRLFSEIQAAPNQSEGLALAKGLWQYWADAPDEVSQKILDRGMTRRSGFDFLGALSDFDTLIAYCPDYAEGYNQRALVNFLRADYEAVLPDLDRAISLSPRHVGAIMGRMATLMALGRRVEAQIDLNRGLALNPWLPERALIEGEKL